LKFIQHPADLPLELLEAYQEQKLIFFCGAGVSNYGEEIDSHYHSFDELCRSVLDRFDLSWEYRPSNLAQQLYIQQRYDELLEYMVAQYGSKQLNDFIQQLFTEQPAILEYSQHQTILKLASGVGGRIVTTNFDTLFTNAQEQLPESKPFKNLYAPTLPIAREEHWEASSIVYLHGGMEDTNPKKRLIYRSSCFGQAYITDGWAARFITELVQHFHLCFVGYSINDPIMNYMMQAIKVNEKKHSCRRFVCHVSDSFIAAKEAQALFKIKGVEPIAFNTYLDMWKILDEWHALQQQDIITLCQQEFEVFDPNAKTLTPEQRYVIQNLITKKEKHFPETQSAYRKVETTSKLVQAVTAKQLPIGLLYAIGRIDTLQRMDKNERKRKSQETETDFALFDMLPNLIQPDFKPNGLSQYGHLFSPASQLLHPVACTWVTLICQNIHQPEVLMWVLEQNDGGYLAPSLVNQLSIALQFSQHEAMPEGLKKGWELLLLNQRLLPRAISNGFDCLPDDQLQNNTLATCTYFTQKLRPYLKLTPPYYYRLFSEQDDENNQPLVYYEAKIEFQQKDLTFHELEKCSEQTTDSEMLVALMWIIENTVHQYLQLFTVIEKNESFLHLFEIPSILSHEQNQDYRQLPQLFVVIQLLLDKLVEQAEIDWCNQAMERYAQQPHTLWHRMVLAYTTKYELNREPALVLLRANNYAYIRAFRMIRKEFYELLEHKANRLPDDILQTCFELLRQPSRDYQQHIEVGWDKNEKYHVLRLLKAQSITLLDEDLETVYQTLLKERKQVEDDTDQFKFGAYSTGFTRVEPDATPKQVNAKTDVALFAYFKGEDSSTHRYHLDLEETFRAFVGEYPLRAFNHVFLPLLAEDAVYYSKLYLRAFDWGLTAYIDPIPRNSNPSAPEAPPPPLISLTDLWTLVESFFMLDTVHDIYQALYSSTAFIKQHYYTLWEEDTPRFWQFFELVWQRAVQKLSISEQNRPDFLTSAINAPIGKLVETLLNLELERLNKNPSYTLLPETIIYLESIPTLENGTMLYSLLGRNLALLLKMHLVWTETYLIPLLTATADPEKTKGVALSEGLIGYGQWTYLVHNHLKESLLQLDMGVHFNETRGYQLFNLYVSRILASYFAPQNDVPHFDKITLVELHAWLASLPTPKSLDCVARELVVYYKQQVSMDEAERLIEQFLAPLLTKGWVNTVDKRTPQQTSCFLQLALVHPKYFGKIISIVKEANLILRLPDEATFHDLCFYWLEKEQLEALALEDFELFCNVILDYLPLQPISTSTYLLQEYLYKRLLAQQTYPLPKALEAYFTRMLRN